MGQLLAFVSYSQDDGAEFASRLGDELRRLSPPVTPWIDLERARGYRFSPKLAKAIGGCDLLLFVITPDSVESPWCQAELGYAVGLGKRVLPLWKDGDVESHVDLEMEGRPPIDFTTWDEGWNELCEALIRIDSPEARLESLETQRAAFRRKASKTKGTLRERYQRKVQEFDARIREESRRQADPERSDREVSEAIQLGLIRETTGDAAPISRSGIRTVNEPPPLFPNRFLDRTHETSRLEERLRDSTTRLVTIVGRDGIGKTAMVSRLLDDLRSSPGKLPFDAFVYLPADGSRPMGPAMLLEDLSRIIPDEVAAARVDDCLSDPRLSLLDKLDMALAQLGGTRVVIVIDDAEELLDSGRRLRDPELDELVRALLLRRDDHGVKLVLVTCDAPEPLLREVAGNSYRLDLDHGLPRVDAERFLRGLDGDGTLGLQTAPAERLEEARRLTEGNPRALELVYSVLQSDPDTSLPGLLQDMDRADEDMLSYLVDRLFDRLELDDRRIMQVLAVYRRPVLPAAVDYLLQWYSKGYKSEPALGRLLDRRLVRQDGDRFYLPRSPDGDRLLEGIPPGTPSDRDRDPPPLTRTALLHLAAGYFVEARRRRVERIGDLSAWFTEIDLRIRGQDYRTALRLIYEIDEDHLMGWGQSDAVAFWRHELVDQLGDERLEFHNLVWLAHARRLQERLEEAKQILQAAISRGGAQERVGVRIELGSVYFENGEVGRARDSYTRAFWGARWHRMKLEEAKARDGLLICAMESGRFRRARAHHARALRALQDVQDEERKVVEADLLMNLGAVYRELGDSIEALELLRYGPELARRLREDLYHGLMLNAQAQVLIDDHPAQAIGAATEAVEIGAKIRSPQLSREANTTLAFANLCAGNLDAAREAATAAARYQRNRRVLGAFALQGITTFRKGDAEGARRAFQDAHGQAELLRDRERRNYQVLDLHGLTLCGLALCGEPARYGHAVHAYRLARKVTREQGVVRRAVRLLNELTRDQDPSDELAQVRRAATGRR